MTNLHFDNNDIKDELVGSSEKMNEVLQRIKKLSCINVTVLIQGEPGTGKELVARTIHQNSLHKHGRFISINCSSVSSHHLEIELFGHEKGSFGTTQRKVSLLQTANNGTLFLNEISALQWGTQKKLLHVLEKKRFFPVGGNKEVISNARVIATTHHNLETMVEKKTFREDLFSRLNIMPIFIPPLRERVDEIEDLIESILKREAHFHKIKGIQPNALNILKSYPWPRNISELKDVVKTSMMIEESEFITIASIPKYIFLGTPHHVLLDIPSNHIGPLDFDILKMKFEKNFIVNALKKNDGKINKTVTHANIPKNTLLRKIKKYNIDVRKYIYQKPLQKKDLWINERKSQKICNKKQT